MGDRRFVLVGAVVAVLGIGSAAAVLRARETTRPLPTSTERLMHLRSGRVADRLFLSFDALAADVYWIRTIQHYGRDRKSARTEGRFELLHPLLDLTTTLDRHFSVAYRFGAIFLAMEPPDGPKRPDLAVALLEKGLDANPKRWQFAHDIGFVHYWYSGDYAQAARWFERTADMPGAPDWVRPLAALTRAQGGDRTGARRLLSELLDAEHAYIRNAAERGFAQLQALDAIDELQAIVERFHTTTGRYPSTWSEVVGAGLLRGVPADGTGAPFVLDPASHRVSLSPESGLFPLPAELAAP
jgi:tetratricopeptide (TPR) repeat protein